ncbi:MAG: DUF2339 domain-containing protein, partial [Candidatus Riflebacteria bacterium]|nr:DUF2339 domain-containing protein [Candidatus Riflebacteria bacterium]
MLEFLLFIFIVYLVASRINGLKAQIKEQITDLENQVNFLNDKVNSLKRQIDRQERTVTKVAASISSPTEKAAKVEQPDPKLSSTSSAPGQEVGKEPPVKPAESGQSAVNLSPVTDGFDALNFEQQGKPVADGQKPETVEQKDQKPHEWLKEAKSAASRAAKISEKTIDKKADSSEKSVHIDSSQSADIGSTVEPLPHKATHSEPPSTKLKSPATGGPGGPKDPEGPGSDDWGEGWRRFKASVDWEQFTGAMLFAWLGGIALFLGAGFFVKYSIDKNLISPVMRLVIGAIVGLGMIGGSFWFERGKYDTMRHTFASGGIGVLYSVFFAATLYYEYLPKPAGFVSLSIISAAAFVLAIFHRGVAISVLGGVGAYLTPLLVTTGQGGLVSLFVYLAVVNIGIYQVVKRLESNALLLFGTVGTMLSLACGTFLASPAPEGSDIFIAWSLNLGLFVLFLDLLRSDPIVSTSVR